MLMRLVILGVMGVLALGSVAPADAVTVNGGLVPGPNLVQDESREAYVDFGPGGVPDTLFGVGDVLVGYIRISDFNTSGLVGNNQVYAVFTQQVVATVPGGISTVVRFGPTTVPGLTMSALLGIAAPAGSMIAVYDSPVPMTDLINVNPAGPPVSMKDYIDHIKGPGHTLRLIAGFLDPDDFLDSAVDPIYVGAPNSGIVSLGPSITVGTTRGNLDVLFNNTAFLFNDVVPVNDFFPGPPIFLSELAISGGSVSGAGGVTTKPTPKAWLSVAGYGAFTQCTVGGVNTPCGFINKNDFNVDVRVPEPMSLLLLGGGLLGLAGVGYLRRRR